MESLQDTEQVLKIYIKRALLLYTPEHLTMLSEGCSAQAAILLHAETLSRKVPYPFMGARPAKCRTSS